MRYTRATIAAAVVMPLAAAPAPTAAQQGFTWEGSLAAGRTLEVNSVNGEIIAVPASGGVARVTAQKTGRGDDPDSVEIRVVEHDQGVTICAVYPAPAGRPPNECRPGGGRSSTRDNDVTVQFRVEVPSGVTFVGRNTNGPVTATGLAGEVRARTTNGDVRVATSGLAQAHTTNGAIDATLGRADWQGELEFSTTNGSVTVTLPATVNAEVAAETTNGSIVSDFPLMVSGRFNRTRLNGTIGSGGRLLRLTTTNGDVEIRRR